MSIVIGSDSFLALRNVQIGELGRQLASHRVLVWVNPEQFEGSRAVQPADTEVATLEDFNARRDPALSKVLRRAYFARKCYYDPKTRWIMFKRSSYYDNRHRPLRRYGSVSRAALRLGGYWLAGKSGFAMRWRKQFADALRRHPVVETYRRRLQRENATVVAALSPEGMREMPLIEAANDLGIPTAVMIRSRDNLAAKIQHLPDASAYFVWSDVTRAFMLHMYPEIPSERVHVIGSPQFDHHLNPDQRLDREAFFSLVGLDPNRPLVVYTMATPSLIDHEIEIAQHLADAAHAGAFVRQAQLLVRGHPRMFGSNVKLLHQEYPEAKSYPAPAGAPLLSSNHEAKVVRLIIEDEPVHLATLAYQDVQVNICGTMTIDSAILDKPTVNVYYDLVEGIASGMSVRPHYERSDVRQMMSYGASRLAHDPDECIRLINSYLENPALDAEGRRRARDEDCGPLDGKAGKRLSDHLRAMAGSKTHSPIHA